MPARYVENISHLSQKHEVQNLPITHFRDKFTLFPIHFPGIIRIDVGAQFIAPWDASILHNDVVEYTYRRAYLYRESTCIMKASQILVRRSRLIPWTHVMWEKQSYTNILYLLLSFPLGLAYFIFLVIGIVVGIGSLIGIFIFVLTMNAWWGLAAFERIMAIQWLKIDIPPMFLPQTTNMARLERIQARLTNSMTWKSLAYLLAKFPFGLLCFCLTLLLIVLTVAVVSVSLVLGFLIAPFFALFLLLRGTPDGPEQVKRFLLLSLLGFGTCILTLHLLNSLAFLAGQFARVMLGMSDSKLRLERTRAALEQERARAEEAEQRRHELVVNVSHDLRTPVASISGHIESLLMATEQGTTTPPPATLHHHLSVVHNEALRLSMLIDDLLSLARTETNELRLDMTAVMAGEVVEEVYQALSPLAARERQVTLVRGKGTGLPPVMADRQRLAQVLLNLVRNAITSTPPGGIVSLTLERLDAHHLALIVEDNGVGIPAEDLERIFERFYRTDISRTRATGGFGLGLTIVHDLVTAMGGSIRVQSTVGKGSKFIVLLPTAP